MAQTTRIQITNLVGNLLDSGEPTAAACDRLNGEIERAVREVVSGVKVTARVVSGEGVSARPLDICWAAPATTTEEWDFRGRVEREVQAASEEGYDRWVAGLTDAEVR